MPPIARGQTWLFQPLPVSTVPNTGRNQSDSGYRGLDEEAILKTLHWLPIRYRTAYKLLLLTFKALRHIAPSYLTYLLQLYHPIPERIYPRQTLYRRHASTVIVPSALVPNTVEHSFKRLLKTHLFINDNLALTVNTACTF